MKLEIHLRLLCITLLSLALPTREESCLSSYPIEGVNLLEILNENFLIMMSEKNTVSIFGNHTEYPIFSFQFSQESAKMVSTLNYLVFQAKYAPNLSVYKLVLDKKQAELVGVFNEFEGSILAIEPFIQEDKIIVSDGFFIYFMNLRDMSKMKMAMKNIKRIHLRKNHLLVINEKVNLIDLKDDGDIDIVDSLPQFELNEEHKFFSVLAKNFLCITQKNKIYSIDLKASILTIKTVESDILETEPALLLHLSSIFYISSDGFIKYLPMNLVPLEQPEEIFKSLQINNNSLMIKGKGTGLVLLSDNKVIYYNLSTFPVNTLAESGCEPICLIPSCIRCNIKNQIECIDKPLSKRACPDGCESCDKNGLCLVCEPDFKLYRNNCIRRKDCLPGEYFDINQNSEPICKSCMFGCLSCNNPINCRICKPDFNLSSQGLCRASQDSSQRLHDRMPGGDRSHKDNDGDSSRSSSSVSSNGGGSDSSSTTIIIATSIIGSLVIFICLIRCIAKHRRKGKKTSEQASSTSLKLEVTSPTTPIIIQQPIFNIQENKVKLNTVVLPNQNKGKISEDEENKFNDRIKIPKGIPHDESPLNGADKKNIPVIGIAIDFKS